jgi:hypothetical protein
MRQQFSSLQINRVMTQSLDYQCACPAQVCGAIVDLRELYDYQANCIADTATDRKMHEAIAAAASQAHEVLEDCLKQVLDMEGWNPETLELPEALKLKPLKPP